MPLALCDLDGVIWLADDPIPGSADAIATLRSRGWRVVFVTNNSGSRAVTVADKLARFGVPEAEVVTSGMVAAELIEPAERVFLVGGAGAAEELRRRGVELVRSGPIDVVVVGITRSFDYEALRRASTAIRAGARFVATNDDKTYPTPAGLIPGAGSLVAAVRAASGVEPIIAGKPYPPMAAYVRTHLGAAALMIGDRGDTDGRLAVELGCDFGLVLSGVERTIPDQPRPAFVADDLAALVRQLQ